MVIVSFDELKKFAGIQSKSGGKSIAGEVLFYNGYNIQYFQVVTFKKLI
jgi:hypothetical protein